MHPPPAVNSTEPSQDRRRDRRHALSGYAILRSRTWSGTEVFGGLVDVSAGGVRLRVRPGTRLEPGQVWAVDLEIALPNAPSATPPVRLWGSGTVVRYDEEAPTGVEAAMRFESPLRVVEGFTVAGNGVKGNASQALAGR